MEEIGEKILCPNLISDLMVLHIFDASVRGAKFCVFWNAGI